MTGSCGKSFDLRGLLLAVADYLIIDQPALEIYRYVLDINSVGCK